jgi:hypothetical protein
MMLWFVFLVRTSIRWYPLLEVCDPVLAAVPGGARDLDIRSLPHRDAVG